LKLRIYNLILKIWNNEQVPEEWTEGVICSISKKGDQRLCNNYRHITLLNVVYKIFSILLHNRLCTMVEHKTGEYQMGFRPNRSTIDNIFMICQIYEKCHEYNIEPHNAFVDFMQAFDLVNRSMIPECLKQYKVPRKLINFVFMDPCILIIYISVQRDATMCSIYSLFNCKITLYVLGAFYTHYQEYRKL
jgi:hypothetical protein